MSRAEYLRIPQAKAYRQAMGTTYSDLFAANLRAARARAGISQKTLAARMQRLGFDSWFDTKVSRTERGQAPVYVGELLGLAVSLDCTLNELVGGNVSPGIVVEMPEGFFKLAGVNIRNSAYGYRDYSVSWYGDEAAVVRPESVQSHMAEDKSIQVGSVHPSRIARNAHGDVLVRSHLGEGGGAAEDFRVDIS